MLSRTKLFSFMFFMFLSFFANAGIELINYQTGQSEYIENPNEMTKEKALMFIPPVHNAQVVFEIYLNEGFSMMEAIMYTHIDILEIEKERIAKLEKEPAQKTTEDKQ